MKNAAAMRLLAHGLAVLMAGGLSACALLPPQQVAPPPGIAEAAAVLPAARSQPRGLESRAKPAAAAMPLPTSATETIDASRLPPLHPGAAIDRGYGGFGAAPQALPPPSSTSAVRSQLPQALTRRQDSPAPSIFLAPYPDAPDTMPSVASPRFAAPLPQVLQAQPGPALSLDFNPNPAWRRAVIPADSKAATVGAVPPVASNGGYTIGAGDTVEIEVLGRPELSAKGNVSGDGRVNVALVGAIDINGLTPVQAAERIAAAYRDGQYLLNPQVTVTLADYQSQLLTVLGEVRSPGRFPMRTRLSVLDGIALAGGVTEQGAATAYLLRPEDRVVTRYEIDLEALIQAGAGQQYFEMLAGDTLVIPKTQVFYIYGEARNPNAYKLKPGMTVIQALSLAGGLTDKGSDRRIDIRRRDADGRLRTLAASLNEPLQADDVVYVRERLF